MMRISMRKFTFIDLFSGAGGLSEGFIRAGYEPLAHIEMNKDACDTLRTRAAFHYLKNNNQLGIYEKYLCEKHEKENGQKLWDQVPKRITDSVIQDTIGEDTIDGIFSTLDNLVGEEKIDIIVGGPPCQAYSIAGRARMGKAVEKDPRNELYKYYVKFLERYHPKMFVFENVLGIISAKRGEPMKDLRELVNLAGYEMAVKVQIASKHGVLQKRQRVIIVGWKKYDENGNLTSYKYPELKETENHYNVLNDLFADFPERIAGEGKLCEPVVYKKSLDEMPYLKESGIRGTLEFTTQHIARPNNFIDRSIYNMAIHMWIKEKKRLDYSKVPAEWQNHKNIKSFLDRFHVVDHDGHCHTVVAHIAKDGHYYIYPNMNSSVENARSITIREAARIQSFPDDYFFEGSRSAAFKQIGNAVPVVLAERIALKIKEQLEKGLKKSY